MRDAIGFRQQLSTTSVEAFDDHGELSCAHLSRK